MSPADLLLGKVYGYKAQEGQDQGEDWEQLNLRGHLAKVEALTQLWWDRLVSAGFPLFYPKAKWTVAKRNMQAGDIVLLKADKKVGKGGYRLGRVLQVLPDSDGLVRTVIMGLRRRRGQVKESKSENKQGLEEIIMTAKASCDFGS